MRFRISKKYKVLWDGSRIAQIKPIIKIDANIMPEEVDQLYEMLGEDDIKKLRTLFKELFKDIINKQ